MKPAYLGKALLGIIGGVPRVTTLDEAGVVASSRTLAQQVADSGFSPTHIVAIANGGIPIARPFSTVFPGAEFVVVTKQRAATQLKEQSSGFKQLVQRSPDVVTTFFRRVEHWSRYQERDFARDPIVLPADDGLIWPVLEAAPQRIIVVDDAVDTGTSIEFVAASARRRFGPMCDVRTAALTISGVNPQARADYALMEGVNIRFFWSKDFKG
ncbi:phosphoribosyltransferase family protein [Devosia sp. FKR38]|uniref:phosphoribosyltransferase n=1 Tax=Devosia sp. FKR38 TaxID=2562312 RepID=UPI00148513DA|nr:phosphoribosyltransferase family protein [Devosia sp. FKR38]